MSHILTSTLYMSHILTSTLYMSYILTSTFVEFSFSSITCFRIVSADLHASFNDIDWNNKTYTLTKIVTIYMISFHPRLPDYVQYILLWLLDFTVMNLDTNCSDSYLLWKDPWYTPNVPLTDVFLYLRQENSRKLVLDYITSDIPDVPQMYPRNTHF